MFVSCSWLVILPTKFERPCGGGDEGGERIWTEPSESDLEPLSRKRETFFWATVLPAMIEFLSPFNLLSAFIPVVSGT